MRGGEAAPAAKEGFQQAFVKLRIIWKALRTFARNVLQAAMIQEEELNVSVIRSFSKQTEKPSYRERGRDGVETCHTQGRQ